jgi:uncharacterized protein (DUF2062 family)
MRDRLRVVAKPIRDLFLRGTSPEKIALCLSCGVTLAVFPVIGATTLLCFAAALVLRLNVPAIQAVNYLASPLQLALLLPLIRAGEFLFGAPPIPFSAAEIFSMVRESPGLAIATLWNSILCAVVAWALLAPFVLAIVYFPMRMVLQRCSFARAKSEAPPYLGGVSC